MREKKVGVSGRTASSNCGLVLPKLLSFAHVNRHREVIMDDGRDRFVWASPRSKHYQSATASLFSLVKHRMARDGAELPTLQVAAPGISRSMMNLRRAILLLPCLTIR